uniref:SCAN box domain-containing protein n=1 Tax=Stegastes partitus TaxID=144197 RepID=A0A3B5B1E3_9TELE
MVWSTESNALDKSINTDPDTFFSLFERVCKVKEWSNKECALLLQCVLTGKAQEAYSCLSIDDSFVYKKIKSAVLKAYELVPEAYRQRFRSWDKTPAQTYVEYVRDLQTHFKRWITALNISTFDDLCELIVLEQFKNVLPDRIATYINERDVTTAADAAVSADEFVLIHRDRFGERSMPPADAGWRARGAAAEVRHSGTLGQFGSDTKKPGQFKFSTSCNYCHERGHWKADCPVLQFRNQEGKPVVKPAALAVPVISVGVPKERAFAPSESDVRTGGRILSRGMGLTVLPIPLHRMVLQCELVQGEVVVGVCPALPIEGVHFVLGYGLAGSRVWTREPPPSVAHSSVVFSEGCGFVSKVSSTGAPVVSPYPAKLAGSSGGSPEAFSAVVTHAMSKTQRKRGKLRMSQNREKPHSDNRASGSCVEEAVRPVLVVHSVSRGHEREGAVHAKTSAILKYPRPTTKKELRRFLALVGQYQSFCTNFSLVVFPLTELLKARAKFIWSIDCQQAFENVKCLLCSSSVLAAPRFDRAFMLQVDASQVGAGAVLLQEDVEGLVRPVCFFSRKFNSSHRHYSGIEREALALIWALQHFQVYVGGPAPLLVYADPNPLTFLRSISCPSRRLIRWSLFLQAYDLDFRHIKGKDNVMADALSRAPVP